ncbi:MAG: DUF5320 domain-containing protein [Bryobacteraceae bacterium]
MEIFDAKRFRHGRWLRRWSWRPWPGAGWSWPHGGPASWRARRGLHLPELRRAAPSCGGSAMQPDQVPQMRHSHDPRRVRVRFSTQERRCIMPFGDRTGPLGLGRGAGRRMGYCSGFPAPGFMNRPAWGFFGGWGGRGWRHWFRATGLTGWQRAAFGWPFPGCWGPQLTPEEEIEDLKSRASFLERALDTIRKRIEELSAKSGRQ